MTYDVFISFKNSDERGNKTKDYAIAKDLYEFLKSKGVSVFFSPSELERLGQTDYSKAIDDALEQSSFLIAVGCSEKNLNSRWVRYEWSSFSNEIKSGRKLGAEVFVVFSDMAINELPFSLRQQQAFNVNESDSFEKLFNFITARLKPSPPPPKPQVFCPRCRAPNLGDAKFCENCGARMLPIKKWPIIAAIVAGVGAAFALTLWGIGAFGGYEALEPEPTIVATPESTYELISTLASNYIYIKEEQFSTSLTELNLSNRNLQNEDIVLLRYMTDLTSLILNQNQISDLTPLSYLTELKVVGLRNNQIYDLMPLSSLVDLEILTLNNNQVDDLSPLANLTNLTTLDLNYNLISDLSPLSNLTALNELFLSWNGTIYDLSPLSDLTKLEQLGLRGNSIGDLQPLYGLTNLKILTLENNQINDISPLANMTSLQEVDLSGNQVADWSPVAHVQNVIGRLDILDYIYIQGERFSTTLTELSLWNRNLQDEDIISLQYMTNLTRLTLGTNQISDLSPLSTLTNLTYLNLENNQISELTLLSGLTNLHHLNLDENQISDLSSLTNLTSLVHLCLCRNQVSDLSPLSNLPNLMFLFLFDNQVIDLSSLSSIDNLTDVWLCGNEGISDLTPLANLSYLQNLSVGNTQVSDWSAVAHARSVFSDNDTGYDNFVPSYLVP